MRDGTAPDEGPEPSRVFLGLGSNLGDRMQNLDLAVQRLSVEIDVDRISCVYETEPVGYAAQPLFLNAVLSGTTRLDPMALLRLAKQVELELGRVRSFRNGPRAIDIDILIYGDTVVKTGELVIPHPRLAERPFVLVPLAEIAPHEIDPRSGRTFSELLANVDGANGVKCLGRLRLP